MARRAMTGRSNQNAAPSAPPNPVTFKRTVCDPYHGARQLKVMPLDDNDGGGDRPWGVLMRALGAFIFAVLMGWGNAAWADKRVALVIGNSGYQNVARLANPANDAAAIATIFTNAKFDVVESRRDLSALEMRRALRDFADRARDADIAVVYYAGHGIEVDGANYLIPVDAQLERDTDVYDETFPLDRILVAIEPAKQLRLIILDACRDNPFARTMKRTLGTRAVGRGLAKVEPSNPNTMIAFAAKAGSTASDGDNRNSPFAAALVNHLTKPGLDLRKAFGFVRDDVLRATSNKQEPFVYGSLGGDDVSLVRVAPEAAAAAPAAAGSNVDVRRDYELALAVGSRSVWDAFIANYPSGFYTELARAQRNKAIAEEARLAATEKARLASEEQARLTAEGARASEQAKALAQAKAAEEARLAAEKKKAAEDVKVAEAERVKAAAQARAAEDARVAAEKKKALEAAKAAEAERIRLAAQAKAAEDARIADEKAKANERAKDAARTDDKPVGPVAALTPPDQSTPAGQPVAADIPKLLQTELRRVGCNTAEIDGNWNAAAQKSLDLFNKHAGMKLNVKVASLDALDAVKGRTGRVCPLICQFGYKADGERCSRITCKAGYEVGDDNTCERIEPVKPKTSRRDKPESKPERAAAKDSPSRQSSGQVMCNQGGCRPVQKGCRIVNSVQTAGGAGAINQVEVCN
jgi:uncharacterized caspase-like protein